MAAVEWLKKNASVPHPRKERKICLINISIFKDGMQELKNKKQFLKFVF